MSSLLFPYYFLNMDDDMFHPAKQQVTGVVYTTDRTGDLAEYIDLDNIQYRRINRGGKRHAVQFGVHYHKRAEGALCGYHTLIELPLEDDDPTAPICKVCARFLDRLRTEGTPKMDSKIKNIQDSIATLQAELIRLASLPQEPEGSEPVIRFHKRFGPGQREYTYAAVKANDGLWYTSGPRTPKGYTWQALVEWIFDGKCDEEQSIERASKFRPL